MPRAPNGELPSVRLIRQVTLTAANKECRKGHATQSENHLTAKGPIQAITFIYLTTPNFFKAQNIRSMELRLNPQPLYPKDYSFQEAFCHHVREYGMGELINFAIEAGGTIYAYQFSACWDSPLLAKSYPPYERSNLVLIVQKR